LIKIIADTTCGLPLEELEALGVDVIPQIIIFDDKPYRDDSEIDTPTFLKKLKHSKTLPKTATPPIALYEPLYKTYAIEGISIVIPTPSAEVSGTYRSTEVAAEMVQEADVHLLDTRTIAGGLGTLVKKAAAWANEGKDPETIVHDLKDFAQREVVFFLVDTL